MLALAFGSVAACVVHPSGPDEPWAHRLACLVPLSLIVGAVLALVTSAA
jgi:hypothetical protein